MRELRHCHCVFSLDTQSQARAKISSPHPDPGNAGADPGNPQTWNAYAYGLNNPLYYTDPTGRYVCDDSTECDSENDKKFAQVLGAAQTAANGLKDQYGANSSQYLDAQTAIDAYGEKGVDNGVDVKFSNDQANPGDSSQRCRGTKNRR